MKQCAIIAFLSFCCMVASGQSVIFTKTFKAKKKNVVVGMINNHPGFFHVLRYNKTVHDLTIERRSKPNGAILAFTPLKLDSVNAGWFNYEKLDYLWYEFDNKLVFVFEKVLNTRRAVYMKIIDTLGKSSGFIELNVQEAAPGVLLDCSFSKGDGNTVLIVASENYSNGVVKKTAVLYDVNKLKQVWNKKLRHENSFNEKTGSFAVNASGDLFYIHYDIRSMSLIRRGPNEDQIINEYGEITLVKSFSSSKELLYHILDVTKIEAVYSATLLPAADDVIFAGYLVEEDFGKKPFLYTEKLNNDFSRSIFSYKYPLPSNIAEQLTFYDGSDYKDPAYKNYRLRSSLVYGDEYFFITERKEENYYKELLSWRLDAATGLLKKVELIPRKIFYFDDRTRFKKMGEVMISLKHDSLYCYLLEDPKNFGIAPPTFKYHSFAKQTNLWDANVVCYVSGKQGLSLKKRIYGNRSFDLIPVVYTSTNSNDEVFYFNEGSYEKFGFIFLQNP